MPANVENFEGHDVRLFPSAHIASSREAELRAAASLLSMVCAVTEFGRQFVRAARGPAGRITCYTEVAFKVGMPPNVKTIRPDGIIRAVRGKRDWAAFVEVKVGDNPLDSTQVDAYHKLARDEGYDALITISNEAALPNGLPPVTLDGRRLRATPVVHLSWERLLADAKVLAGQQGIADTDQAWMLEEWIRYVADPESRIIEPPVLGKAWGAVVAAARENKLASASVQLRDVVGNWDAFLKKAALQLRAKMGVAVERRATRADVKNPQGRTQRLHAEVLGNGVLSGSIKIPDAIGDVDIEVILAGRTVRYSVGFRAPNEGRLKTRLNWILRQLKADSLPSGLSLQVEWDHRRLTSEAAVSALQAGHALLLVDPQGKPIPAEAMPRAFRLSWTTRLAKGRGHSGGHVLAGISAGLERFYRDVVEGLVPFVPKAPQLPEEPEPEPTGGEAAGPTSEQPAAPSTSTAPSPAPSGESVVPEDPAASSYDRESCTQVPETAPAPPESDSDSSSSSS